MTLENTTLADRRRNAIVLQEIQPGLLGLMDGSVSTLAPIFAAAGSPVSLLVLFLSALPRRLARPSAWASPKRCPTMEV
jgi:erythrin-vacuolar iron transport family protein